MSDWTRHHPPGQIGGTVGISADPPQIDDGALVERIIAAFRRANQAPTSSAPSIWTTWIADAKQAEHRILLEGSDVEVAQMLRDPGQTQLFLGFDNLVRNNPWGDLDDPGGGRETMRQWSYDCLLRLAEAVGSVPLAHPEELPRPIRDVEELLTGLDTAFGFPIRFPNPFPGEVGLQTARGVATFLAIQALYQAWHMFQLINQKPSAKILEIGAGLGRVAYFVRQFGLSNYTIIDLPLTSAAQAYFLGTVLSPDTLRLFGETHAAPLAILPPSSFLTADDRYDLILNADSMTEMGLSTARNYWHAIKHQTPLFLSINHEQNEFTVREIITATPGLKISRAPYWLRRGYVEELVEIAGDEAAL